MEAYSERTIIIRKFHHQSHYPVGIGKNLPDARNSYVKFYFTYDTLELGGMKMVGVKIRDLRKKLGFTQEQLAGSELTKSYVSQVELGRIRPSRNALAIMARRLGKPLGYFLENDDDIRTVDVLLKASQALWSSGRLDEALVGLKEAYLLAERMGRDDILARIQATMGYLEMTRGDYDTAIHHFKRSLEELSPQDAPKEFIETTSALARSLHHIGNTHQAIGYFEKSCSISIDLPDLGVAKSDALMHYGDFCFELEEWTSALDLYQRAHDILLQSPVHVPFREPELLTRVATAACSLHQQELAFTTIQTALAQVKTLPSSDASHRLRVDMSRCLIQLQQYDTAHQLLRESLTYFDQNGQPEELFGALVIGYFLIRGGRRDDLFDLYFDVSKKLPGTGKGAILRAQALILHAEFVADDAVDVAIHDVNEALALDPDNDDVKIRYYTLLAKAGSSEALAQLWNLLRDTPTHEPRKFSTTPFLSGHHAHYR